MSSTSRAAIGREFEQLDRERDAARLGFGCAGLMRSASRRHRQRLLAEAFERGIRHFDVGRMYGLGAAEGELGRFARRRRDRIAIATKFGIEVSGPAGRLASLQAPARAAVARFPALRRRLKRRDGAFHQPRRYDLATMRASLETSLRALGTDYVDFLFIHDPGPGDRVDLGELGEALEEMRRSGRVRAWGVAGDPDPCLALAAAAPVPIVVQLRDDVFAPALPPLRRESAPIVFGVLGEALARVSGHLEGSKRRRASWSAAVGADCGDPEVVAALLLQDALDRNRGGTVLFATTHPRRVAAATAAAEALSGGGAAQHLSAFRQRLLAELGAGVAPDG